MLLHVLWSSVSVPAFMVRFLVHFSATPFMSSNPHISFVLLTILKTLYPSFPSSLIFLLPFAPSNLYFLFIISQISGKKGQLVQLSYCCQTSGHTHMHTCTHARTHTHAHTHTHTCTHARTNLLARLHELTVHMPHFVSCGSEHNIWRAQFSKDLSSADQEVC